MHGATPGGQVATEVQVAGSRYTVFVLQPQPFGGQQLRPVLHEGLVPQRQLPTLHCSLNLQPAPQRPQCFTSVRTSTQAPLQQRGVAAGQSPSVQHWLFGMHPPPHAFCPLGHATGGGGLGGGQVAHEHPIQDHQSLLFHSVQDHCLPHTGDRISEQLRVTFSQINDMTS
jgi:hypothetical protein